METSTDVRFPITITHFINPHVFYFKLENIIGTLDGAIDHKIRTHATFIQSKYPKGYHPSQNEIVSVFVYEWDKWVRAQVDLILNGFTEKQYVVWCLDRGIPLKVGAKNVLPMATVLKLIPPTVSLGGLARCVPVGKRFNYSQMRQETEPVDDFPEGVVSITRQMLEEAAEIFFVPRKCFGRHIFGDIEVTPHTGRQFELIEVLLKQKSIIAEDDFIPRGIERMKSMKKNRYENHLGQSVARGDDKIIAIYPKLKPARVRGEFDEVEEKIVIEWSTQNHELAETVERDMIHRFNELVKSLDQYEAPAHVEREPYKRMYNFGSSSSLNCSNLTLNNFSGSQTNLTEVQSVSTTSGKPRMSRLAQRLKDVSIESKPELKVNEGPSKVVCIPSGFEREILDFHKYNLM